MSIDIGAEFMIDLGRKVDQVHRKVHQRPRPIRKPIGNSNTGTAPLVITANTEEVPPGRMYNLLSVNLYGADGHTTLASAVADLYRASSGVQLPDFSAQIASGLTVPVIPALNYSKEVIWIEPGENLIAIVYGFAGSQQITMVAQIADYPLEEMEATYIP